jgi:lipopolysaccharide/colanic/teichoic acid biosynthesis glycosyltransferase
VALAEPRAVVAIRETFYTRHGKRVMDVALALVLLPILLPVMALIALGMAHRGQIIYGHRRVGRHGREFTCYKFRTMVVDADLRLADILSSDPKARAEWAGDHKLRDDPRITRLGRVLRKTSLDELPQLWNVLRGDMSFVGPRPVTRAELVKYGDVAAAYLSVRPGVTGPWQVSGRSEVSYTARVMQDADYIAGINLASDAVIIAQTVLVPFKMSGR